jgi:DNA polymerase-3 subunit beta
MNKLIISTDVLKPALKTLGQAIAAKPAIPALSSLYARTRSKDSQVELITSDLELTISCLCSCECKEDFEMLLPFDLLSKLVQLLPGEPLTIELHKGNKGSITGGNDSMQLGVLAKVEEYPKVPDIPKKNTLELTGEMMTWLDRSMATIGKDEARPAMTRALLEIQKDGITIVSSDAHCLFRHNDKYPDYKIVIPNHDPNLEIYRADLLSALRRVSLINDASVSFFFSPSNKKGFLISASNADLERNSEHTVAGVYTGKAPSITFSPKLLANMLNQIPFDNIRLHIDAPTRAALITAEEDENYLGMIMPRVN